VGRLPLTEGFMAGLGVFFPLAAAGRLSRIPQVSAPWTWMPAVKVGYPLAHSRLALNVNYALGNPLLLFFFFFFFYLEIGEGSGLDLLP